MGGECLHDPGLEGRRRLVADDDDGTEHVGLRLECELGERGDVGIDPRRTQPPVGTDDHTHGLAAEAADADDPVQAER